jgi:hypothetical protein
VTRARQKTKSWAVCKGRLNLANEWLRCFTEAIPFARSGWQRVLLRLLVGYKNRLHKRVDPKFRPAGYRSIGTNANDGSQTCPTESALTKLFTFLWPRYSCFHITARVLSGSFASCDPVQEKFHCHRRRVQLSRHHRADPVRSTLSPLTCVDWYKSVPVRIRYFRCPSFLRSSVGCPMRRRCAWVLGCECGPEPKDRCKAGTRPLL